MSEPTPWARELARHLMQEEWPISFLSLARALDAVRAEAIEDCAKVLDDQLVGHFRAPEEDSIGHQLGSWCEDWGCSSIVKIAAAIRALEGKEGGVDAKG